MILLCEDIKKDFGMRLRYLFKEKGIDTYRLHAIKDIAIDMLNNKYIPVTPNYHDDDTARRAKIKAVSDTIRRHLDTLDVYSVNTHWIMIYHNYFQCSYDFLMGEIDRPTQEKSDIYEVTGLSDKAIALLKYRKENEDKPKDRQDNLAADLSMINNVLCSSGFDQLIAGIYNYIYLDYNVPVFHTGNKIEIKGKPYLEMAAADKPGDYNPDAEKYLLHFAKDKNTPYEYTSVVVDKDFLETAATDKIKKALDIIKADILDKQKRGLL